MMNSQKNIYRPLPENTTILKSNIEGLGLFATEDIDKNKTLGVSHVKHHDYLNGFIRTPLGAFYNHTGNEDTANCKTIEGYWYDAFVLYLITTKTLNADEEILVQYTMYELI